MNTGYSMHQTLASLRVRLLLYALLVFALNACDPVEPKADEKEAGRSTFTAATYSLNYSSEYFITYTVYDATVPDLPAVGGASVTPLGGGDQGCCIALPQVWRPGLKVLLKWSNGDSEKTLGEYSREFEIPRYAEPGNLFVSFFDAEDVELLVSPYSAGHPQWPGRIKTDPMSHCLATESDKKQCSRWSPEKMTRPSPKVLLDGCDFEEPNEACRFLIQSCKTEFGNHACSAEGIKGEEAR